MSPKKILIMALAISTLSSLGGCKSEESGDTSALNTNAMVNEISADATAEASLDILPEDLVENIKKSLDSLESLETNIMVYSDLDVKFGKLMQDDLDFDLAKVEELKGKLDDYYTLNNTSDMTIKFDSDSMYVKYKITEENGLVHELNADDGIKETVTEQYLELDGEQRLFQCDNGEKWESTKVYDLNDISVNPVQTTIELLSDFKPNNHENIELADTMIIEGTISSTSARAIFENSGEGNERVPAKIVFDNKNNQIKTIKIDLISMYTNEYLFDLMKPSTIEGPDELGDYMKPSRYEIIMTFSNANNTSVSIPKEVLEPK